MKSKLSNAFLAASFLFLCCSGGASIDFSGGGVIGNPSGFSLSYTDTIHSHAVNTFGNPGGVAITVVGNDTAKIGQAQKYSCIDYDVNKRFLFSDSSEKKITAWSSDSAVTWIWKSAGTYLVQVQATVGQDTSEWSEPLVVRCVE